MARSRILFPSFLEHQVHISKTICFLSVFFLVPFLYGKNVTWRGNHNNNSMWTSGQNWTTPTQISNGNITFVASGDNLFFQGTKRVNNNNDLTNASYSGITFNSGSGNFILSGNQITLTGGITNNSLNTQRLSFNKVIINATRSVNVAAGDLIIQSIIQGSGGLSIVGSNTVNLNGVNTYTGATTVTSGTISVAATTGLGMTSAVNLSSGAELNYTGATATLSRAISVNSGISTVSNTGSGLLTLSGAISKDGTTLVLNGGAQGINVTGVISGASANSDLDVYGDVVLSAENTYNGPTTIYNGGNLTAAVANAMGSTTNVVVHNGGSLLVQASNAINDSSSMELAGGTWAFDGNINETVGALTLSANSTIDMAGGHVALLFSNLAAGLSNTTRLNIFNYTPNSDSIAFSSNAHLSDSLQFISFYSDSGSSLIENSFMSSSGPPWQVQPFPEPETWVTALLLLGGGGFWLWRKTRAASS